MTSERFYNSLSMPHTEALSINEAYVLLGIFKCIGCDEQKWSISDNDESNTFEIPLLDLMKESRCETILEIREALRSLAARAWWSKNKDMLLMWFDSVRVLEDSSNEVSVAGVVHIRFNRAIHSLLRRTIISSGKELMKNDRILSNRFISPLVLKGKYSASLFALIEDTMRSKSKAIVDISSIIKQTGAHAYLTRWPDVRRRILDPSIDEINDVFHLNLNYVPENIGSNRKVLKVAFFSKPFSKTRDAK